MMSQETKWTMLNSCQHFYSKMVDLNIVLYVDWDKNQMFLFVGSSSIPFVLGRITVLMFSFLEHSVFITLY